jgi:hypothetical protein
MLKVKLLARGKALTPYVAKVTTNGKQQKWFKETYGKPMGNCVRSNVKKGMTPKEIKDAVRKCAGKSVS